MAARSPYSLRDHSKGLSKTILGSLRAASEEVEVPEVQAEGENSGDCGDVTEYFSSEEGLDSSEETVSVEAMAENTESNSVLYAMIEEQRKQRESDMAQMTQLMQMMIT